MRDEKRFEKLLEIAQRIQQAATMEMLLRENASPTEGREFLDPFPEFAEVPLSLVGPMIDLGLALEDAELAAILTKYGRPGNA